MRLRTAIVPVAALACHLFLAGGLVTCQTPAAPPASDSAQEAPATTSAIAPQVAPTEQGELVVIKAREQEKQGDEFQLRGDAEIDFRDYIFRADQITYNARTAEVTATGNVTLDGGAHNDHLQGSKGHYNLKTQRGEFDDVSGTVGVLYRNGESTFTSSNPIAFSGKKVERDGPDRFILYQGTVTSCKLPNPKWIYSAGRVVVDVGDRAYIYNSLFKVKGVPVFYFPFASHPVERLPRQSGFLIPSYGSSSRKGTVLGDAFYWAINRSMDAQAGAEYYSKRGWAQHYSFRAKPSDSSFFGINYYGVLDRGEPGTGADQGGREIKANGEWRVSRFTRAYVSADYLSSFVFRLAFAQSFSEVLNSEVTSRAFLSHSRNGFSWNVLASRYQNFQSTNRGDVIQILNTPSVELSGFERPVAGSKLHWSFDVSGGGLSRREPQFATADLVGRVDVYPRVSLPISYKGWSFRPEVGARETYYSQRLLPAGSVGIAVDQPANRHAVDASLEILPPSLSRVFQKRLFHRQIKHSIEPRVRFHYVKGVDNFENILRFDGLDILADTTELEYGITNRIYAKGPHCDTYVPESAEELSLRQRVRPVTECGDSAREVLSWDIASKYYFNDNFSGALVDGRRNVFAATADLTGIAFLTERRSISPIVSRLRLHGTRNLSGGWQLDYDPLTRSVNTSFVDISMRFGDFFTSGGHAFLRAPGELITSGVTNSPSRFSQYRAMLGYGRNGKRGLSAAASIGVDANRGFIQSSAFQGNYNWDCCGVGLEYRRFALGPLRTEDQVRFNFTLINIGSFGTLGRAERLY
jgi:LPS-assembly protein